MAKKLKNSKNEVNSDIEGKPYLNLELYRVKPTDNYEPPIKMLTQTIKGKSYTIGTLGNISMVIGKAKARKSFLINMMITTALAEGVSYGMFQCDAPDDKRKVLYLDTEQSKDMVWRAVNRVCKQLEISNPNMETLALRSINPRQRLEVVEAAIEKTDGVGLVIIDGISDLVTSINDEEQATNLSSVLMRLTEEYNIHIMTVLHTNKGDNHARGHLGTYFQNKAETTIEITVNEHNKDISNVEAKYSRDEEIIPFAIRINDIGLPIIEENFSTAAKKDKPKKGDISQEALWKVLNQAIIGGKGLQYGELIENFKGGYLKVMNDTIGDSIIKHLIAKAVLEGVLLKDDEPTYAIYTLGTENIEG